jgi:two-component system, LytTR family, response regulator
MKPYFFIRTERQFVKINHCDIICIESLSNYVTISTVNGNFITLLSLRQLEGILPKNEFRRISKSCIVSLDYIISFDKEYVYFKNKQVSFGEKYRHPFEQSVVITISDTKPRVQK